MKNTRTHKFSIRRVLFFALFVLITGCEKTGHDEVVPGALKKVEVWQATPEFFQETIVASAPASAFREHHVSAEVPGMLQVKHVERGDRIKKGDVLFQIDPEGFELRVKEQSALLARTEAKYRFMQSEVKRKEQLFRDKTLSRAGWEQAQFDVAFALAEKDQAETALLQAKRDLKLTTLASPMSGMVLETYRETGEVVPVGLVFALIADASRVTFDVGVSDLDLPGLSLGLQTDVHIDALPGQKFVGTITTIAGNASPEAGTFPVEVTVENKTEAIMPGMIGRISLPGKIHEKQMIMPMMAVHQHLGETFIFVVNGQQVFLKPVVLEKVLGDRVLVSEGVETGDQIVIVSQGRLKDGDNVEVIQ